MSRADVDARRAYTPTRRPFLTCLRKHPVTLTYVNTYDGKIRGRIGIPGKRPSVGYEHCWDFHTGKYAGTYGHADYRAARKRDWIHGYDLINAPDAVHVNTLRIDFETFSGVDLAEPGTDTTVIAIQETKMNPIHKPFDLEAAKAGKELITRAGRTAKFVAHVPEVSKPGCHLLALIEGTVYCYHDTGRFSGCTESHLDLFLKSEPLVYYVKFYDTRSAYGIQATFYNQHPGRQYDNTVSIQKIVCEPGRFDE